MRHAGRVPKYRLLPKLRHMCHTLEDSWAATKVWNSPPKVWHNTRYGSPWKHLGNIRNAIFSPNPAPNPARSGRHVGRHTLDVEARRQAARGISTKEAEAAQALVCTFLVCVVYTPRFGVGVHFGGVQMVLGTDRTAHHATGARRAPTPATMGGGRLCNGRNRRPSQSLAHPSQSVGTGPCPKYGTCALRT